MSSCLFTLSPIVHPKFCSTNVAMIIEYNRYAWMFKNRNLVLWSAREQSPVTQDLASSTQEMETGQACIHRGVGNPIHFRCSVSEFFSRVTGKMFLWRMTGGLIFPWRVAKRWCWAAMLQTIGMMYFTYQSWNCLKPQNLPNQSKSVFCD